MMNHTFTLPSPVPRSFLTWCGFLLACSTVLLELILIVAQPQELLIESIGGILGLIMAGLWLERLLQRDAVLLEPRPLFSSYPGPYPAPLQPQLRSPSAPEQVSDSADTIYRDEYGVQCFLLAKGNEPAARSQDAFALDNNLKRYAVTDGVSRSFLPSYWARILATRFVRYPQGIEDQTHFAEWLQECNNEWLQQAQQWIRRAEKRSREQGLSNETDWQQQINIGAQATLIGCQISPSSTNNGTIRIHITAIGDANFFLMRRTRAGSWGCVTSYPHHDPGAFDTAPHALATAATLSLKRIQRTWDWIGEQPHIAGHEGDYILLTTDAIAKWLLQQLLTRQEDWYCFLDPNTTPSAIARLIFNERKVGRLEDDDITILVVPL
jgi:hypothetical protein